MAFLLKKENQQKIDILNYLELSPSQTASIKQISEDLLLSTFIIKKALTQVSEDLSTHHIFGLKLIESQKKITFTSDGSDSILTLKWIYLKQSTLFLLLDGFFKEEYSTLESFSKKYFLSLPTAYLLKVELEKHLQHFNLSISSELTLEGQEKTLRFFMFNVYFHYFNSLELPFSKDLINLVENFINNLSFATGFSYSATQRLKLHYFLLVTFQRLYHGQTLTKNESLVSFNSIQLKLKKTIFSFFDQTTSLTTKENELETSFLISFLYSENLIPNLSSTAALSFIHSASEATVQLTSLFLNALKKMFDISIEMPNYTYLQKELNRIHYKYLNFNEPLATPPFQFNTSFLKENYPDFFIFIDDFTQKNLILLHETDTLYYDYLFTLIKYIPLSLLTHPIYVCVDFSRGRSYNHFIATNIKSFKFLNIVIEKRISDNTNLYLSDFKPTGLTLDFILWKNPPLPSDWEHFGNKIIELKNNER
ncbi:helix-turn-helix domain-containing protein [Carnobacterium divergens]|uniref:DNA-binding protein n=1 Tax=Carnobacterium divergens TaxID=2748 RepID=A0A2R8A392_CARDV|nr:helix-turn-helix domain-containing protein [Carnobacterium divergens]MCO6016795.1 helix-turn-helix domain-containing protein [Carnobacterium divergens]MPQ23454.1 DNA-binding protein [Carnobacterium divergens]TFI62654.1 DNA-binding protein [Carnobacterium divergens]TFI72773.1 DNA-binding protein [Carnobacterium divergens]TFI77019.1 DNA-binding protein [Carnobacterium divergens]